jgi:hypothetical protein
VQLSDAPADDKSKKKKRLDDLLSGLHAGKGNAIPEKKESPTMDSLFKKATESVTDLTKLQEMLGPLGGNPADAKVCTGSLEGFCLVKKRGGSKSVFRSRSGGCV